MLLQRVRASGQRDLNVRWRYFSLAQVNSPRPRWKVWRTPDRVPGNQAFRAAEAAREQGPEAFDRYHAALLEARHVDRADLDDGALLLRVAGAAGLDVQRLTRVLANTSLEALGRDHSWAVATYGAFGTPTFVLPETGAAAYVRIRPAPEGQAALATFDQLLEAMGRPYLLEIKRPQPPG